MKAKREKRRSQPSASEGNKPEVPLEQLLRLAEDTRQQVSHYFGFNRPDKRHKGWWIKQINKELENPALFFYKLIPSPEEEPMKASFLEAFAGKASQAKSVQEILQAQGKRLHTLIEALKSQGYQPAVLECRVAWRMIVGLGMAHVYETGMLLHSLYGFPYIPGSAIKGLTRSYAFSEIARALGLRRLSLKEYQERKSKKQKTPLEKLEDFLMATKEEKLSYWQQLQQDNKLREWESPARQMQPEELGETFSLMELFQQIFGTTVQQGQVIFLDVLPVGGFTLERDIMNPHYGDYYMGKKDANGNPIPPADWLKPNPIFFLTVGNKTRFRFYLASQDQGLLRQAKCWLEKAVEDFGIGAKTSSDYGRMEQS